jgi:hypothetical protein
MPSAYGSFQEDALLSSYLDFILATKGQSDARKQWLSAHQG